MGLFGKSSKADAQVGGSGNIVIQNSENVTIYQARREQIIGVVNDYLAEQGVSRDDIDHNRAVPVPLPREILHQINCDRKRFKRVFEKAFRSDPPPGHRVFVLPATPDQQPGSFAERMVLELQTERSKRIHRPVDDWDRMKFVPLQLGLDEEDTIASFSEQFNEFLQVPHGQITTLCDFYNSETSLSENDFVVVPFMLHSSEWETYVPALFDWMLNTFCSEKTGSLPGFLFFITLIMEPESPKKGLAKLFGGGKSQHDKILDSLKPFENHDKMVLFEPLPGVPVRDLKAWFRESNFIQNEMRIRQIINTAVANTKGELEQALTSSNYAANDDLLLDMSFVELLLEDIIKNNQPKI